MEEEFVQKLIASQKKHDHLLIGIGDDAAVLNFSTGHLVVTTDLLTENVDFILGEIPNNWIGRKAIAVNLSDLAAMAAEPVGIVVAVALPRKHAATLADELYEGIMQILDQYDTPLLGGDTNTWDEGLVISVTAIGKTTPQGPLKRSGAKPGDRILVTGQFGGSILKRQFLFEPRIKEALFLNQNFTVHAAMDVSDGLSLDLSRMASCSGCGTVIDLERVPIHKDALELSAIKEDCSPLEHALQDGEDFELLLAVPPQEAEILLDKQPLVVPLTDIGELIDEKGQWFRHGNGTLEKVIPKGFWHH